MKHIKWFDENGWMKLSEDGGTEENGVLFTAYYCLLTGYIPIARKASGNFLLMPNHISHDNITGFNALRLHSGMSPKLLNSWKTSYLHPRDFLFWKFARGIEGCEFVLRWIMKNSIKKHWDWRHEIQFTVAEKDRSFVEQMKVRLCPIFPKLFKSKRRQLATSGKLLNWLRCHALGGEWKTFWYEELEPAMPFKMEKAWETYFGSRHPITEQAKR